MTTRSLGLLAIALLLSACANVESDDPTASDWSALEAPVLNGDRDGLAEPGEVDPTKAPGYAERAETTIAEAPARVVLEYVWKGQETSYWCGPGSVRTAISSRTSTLPTQTELARFMGTTTDGTARADTVRALNKWLNPPTPYVSIPMDMAPTDAQRTLLKQTLISRLSSGWPIVANVLSGWRPPGYPSGRIGHFVAVVGYENNGDRVLIADPAGEGAAGPSWVNVPRTYWISFKDLGTWIGGRGYTGN